MRLTDRPGPARQNIPFWKTTAARVLVCMLPLSCNISSSPPDNQAINNITVQLPPVKRTTRTKQKRTKTKTGIPRLPDCTNRDLNEDTRTVRRILRGIVPDDELPQYRRYCRGDADLIIGGKQRNIQELISKNIPSQPRDRIFVGIRVSTTGALGFLFGSHLRRTVIGNMKDGAPIYRIEKVKAVFPVEEINAVLQERESPVHPPEDSQVVLRFGVSRSGKVYRLKGRR